MATEENGAFATTSGAAMQLVAAVYAGLGRALCGVSLHGLVIA